MNEQQSQIKQLPSALADLTAEKPLLSNTEQTSQILGAKTGKAQSIGLGAGPRQSNLAEKAAIQGTQSQLNQQAQERSLNTQNAQAQEQGINQAAEQKQEQLTHEQLDNQTQYMQRAQQIMNDWKRQGQQIDFQKRQAQMEQLKFTMRLSNEKYVSDLKRNGQKSRLQNKLVFNENLQKAMWDDEADLFNSSLDFKKLLNQDKREFETEMSQRGMDIAMAIQIANAKADSIKQTWTGVGQLGQAGVAAYGQMDANENKQKEDYLKYETDAQDKGKSVMSFEDWTDYQKNRKEELGNEDFLKYQEESKAKGFQPADYKYWKQNQQN